MSTPLILLGLQINQKITDFTKIPYLLSWDVSHHKWILVWNINRRLLYPYFKSLILIIGLVLPLCNFIVIKSLKDPATLSFTQILLAAVCAQLINVCIVVDLSLIVKGSDLVTALEWFHKLEIKLNKSNKLNESTKATKTTKLLKILKEKFDLIGLTILQIAFLYPLVAIITSVAGVFYDRDPFYLTYFIICKQELSNNMLFLIFRLACCILTTQVIATNNKTITIAVIDACVVGLNCTKRVTSSSTFSFPCFRSYRELQIVFATLQEYSTPMLAGWLSVIFFTLVTGGSFSILSLKSEKYLLAIFSSFITGVTFFMAMFVFYCCCMAHEMTLKLLLNVKWKKDVMKSRGAYFRRVLRACSPIALNVGPVGILDQEIKMNYFNAVLTSVANLLLVTWQLQSQRREK